MDEEWRVSLSGCVQLASGKPVSAGTVRDLLGSRVGREVSVTAGKAGIFLYAATADAAAAAAGSAREVLAEQGLAADIRVERWEPSGQAWLPPGDAGGAEPPSGQERGPVRRRLRAAGEVIAAMIDGIGSAGSLSSGQSRRLSGARSLRELSSISPSWLLRPRLCAGQPTLRESQSAAACLSRGAFNQADPAR